MRLCDGFNSIGCRKDFSIIKTNGFDKFAFASANSINDSSERRSTNFEKPKNEFVINGVSIWLFCFSRGFWSTIRAQKLNHQFLIPLLFIIETIFVVLHVHPVLPELGVSVR